MMFGGTNRREHCGLGRDKPSSHEATSEHKKSRTLPVRAREGSAKNLLIGRRETPSKTQRHYGPLLVFIPISKSSLKNLADFHVLFAEITDVKNSEPDPIPGNPFQFVIYPPLRRKSSPQTKNLSFFSLYVQNHMNIYNGRRLHSSLGYLTPDSIYKGRCVPGRSS